MVTRVRWDCVRIVVDGCDACIMVPGREVAGLHDLSHSNY